jgi:hypothetical protein
MQNYLLSVNKTDNRLLSKKITVLCILIFLYSTFSGSIRKWGGASGLINNIVFGIQLLLPFLFLLLRRPGYRSPFNKLLLFYSLILFLLALNPMNLTIFHGLFGLLIHLGFWVCCFFYIRNRELFNLKKIIWLFLFVALIEIVLAFIQYNLPPTHFLNAYANEGEVAGIATTGGKVRVTGTFSYLGGFYAFFTFFPLVLWGLIRRQYPRYIIIILYLAGMVACFMSGSRSTLYMYLIIGALMVYSEGGLKMLVQTLGGGILIVGIMYTFTFFLEGKFGFISDTVTIAYETFEGRRKSNAASGEEQARISTTYTDVIFYTGEYPLLGVGLGATYQGATSTFGTSHYVLQHPSYIEEEPERIVLEGGFVLFLFKIILLASFLKYIRIPVLAKIILGVIIFLYIPIVFNVYNAIYIFLGLVFLDSSYNEQKEKDIVKS